VPSKRIITRARGDLLGILLSRIRQDKYMYGQGTAAVQKAVDVAKNRPVSPNLSSHGTLHEARSMPSPRIPLQRSRRVWPILPIRVLQAMASCTLVYLEFKSLKRLRRSPFA
jgi:hypothetical protein